MRNGRLTQEIRNAYIINRFANDQGESPQCKRGDFLKGTLCILNFPNSPLILYRIFVTEDRSPLSARTHIAYRALLLMTFGP